MIGLLFPVFLNLETKKCLVIGGGTVAYRKITNLLEHQAEVTVVSLEVNEAIQALAVSKSVALKLKPFSEEDLEDVYLTIAATDNSSLNQQAARLCRQRGMLINVVDDPSNCDFFVPSVVRRKSLAVAISTEGKSPLFARLLRQELETVITEDYGELVEFLGEKREEIKNNFVAENRKRLLEALINEETLALLKRGEIDTIRERIEECIFSWRD